MSDALGSSRCDFCGAEFRLFTLSNRDMQALTKGWKGRHERSCQKRTPAQRLAWAQPYAGKDSTETSITVDLAHSGFVAKK